MLIAKCIIKKDDGNYHLEFCADHVRCVPSGKIENIFFLELESLSVFRIVGKERYSISCSMVKIKGFLSSLPSELLGEVLDAYGVSSLSVQMQHLNEEIRKLYEDFHKIVVHIQGKDIPKYIPICTGHAIMAYNMIFASEDRAFYERNGEFYNLRFRDMSLMEDTEKSYLSHLRRVIKGKKKIEYIITDEIEKMIDDVLKTEKETDVQKTDIQLPKEEYVHLEENGKQIRICTMRQKAMHTIGLDAYPQGRLYTRHGRKYYKLYRNYFTGYDGDLEQLVCAGYMVSKDETVFSSSIRTYWFNRKGLDWLGEQLGIVIHNEEG